MIHYVKNLAPSLVTTLVGAVGGYLMLSPLAISEASGAVVVLLSIAIDAIIARRK